MHAKACQNPHCSQPSLKSPSFKIIQRISSSRFSVYTICFNDSNQHLALKLFPFKYNKPNKSFIAESRFITLCHENVIAFIYAEERQKVKHKDNISVSSYILMELAPYGDFVTLFNEAGLFEDPKLIRTFFHQLINGIEYLHSQGVAHMDLKLDNLLLGEKFKLKIADFDCAYKSGDLEIHSRGTRNYRAPEVRQVEVYDPFATDIYSAGVILFKLMTKTFPYVEDTLVRGYDLEQLLRSDPSHFWEVHENFNPVGSKLLDEDFKSLFMSMIRDDPVERATIQEIKQSKWYKGEVYREKEYKYIVSSLLELNN